VWPLGAGYEHIHRIHKEKEKRKRKKKEKGYCYFILTKRPLNWGRSGCPLLALAIFEIESVLQTAIRVFRYAF